MYGALDISTSGMVAQRTRLATIAGNIANAGTILNERGEADPYRRREAHFSPGDPSAPSRSARKMGVHVREIAVRDDAVRLKYAPGNPYADEQGYLRVPDISVQVEQLNALTATRAYEANVAAAETTKTMMAQALRLIA